MVVVSISKDILHKTECFFKQTQQPLAVWCSLNNKCVRMYVCALSEGSERIRAKVLKYFKTCKVRLNTLSWYLLLWTWTDMNCIIKSQALLKQILMKAALNVTGSCHSSSEVITVKKTIINRIFLWWLSVCGWRVVCTKFTLNGSGHDSRLMNLVVDK